DIVHAGIGFLGNAREGVAFLHGITDAFLGVILAEAGLDVGARGLPLGQVGQRGIGLLGEFLHLSAHLLQRLGLGGGGRGLDRAVELGNRVVELRDRGIGLGGVAGLAAQLVVLAFQLLDADLQVAYPLGEQPDILPEVGNVQLRRIGLRLGGT